VSEFEEVDFEESDSRQQDSPSSQFKDFARGAGCLVVIGLVIWLGVYGWGRMKRVGWIAQSRVIDVYISGDWLTGEYRSCRTGGRADGLFCPGLGGSQTALAASGQSPRQFTVSFYGTITGKPEDILNWKCKRETDSISCHAVR
jgi:hypothetical protein